jgi:hypothetical protein
MFIFLIFLKEFVNMRGNILSVSRVNGLVRISVVGSEPAENYEIHYVSRSTVTGRQLS